MADNKSIKTYGHHFTDMLACTQKAWLHYHGDAKKKAAPPPYLLALQREGQEIERRVYAEQYPEAVKIKANRKTRLQETVNAMRAGHPAILQGYIEVEEGAGIIDVLELAGRNSGSTTKYDYRIGEIKRSPTLKTAHVLQAAWYADILAQYTGQGFPDAFFILGSGSTEVVSLTDFWPEYEQAKIELFAIRDSKQAPGPYLNIACPSCDWRAICLPQLSAKKHLSLIPGLNAEHIHILEGKGISAWSDFHKAPDNLLEAMGFTLYEIERLRKAHAQLAAGHFPLRRELKSSIFAGGVVVAVEFYELRGRRRLENRHLIPKAIHYELEPGHAESINVQETRPDVFTADVCLLNGKEKLLFYGLQDLAVYKQIARQSANGPQGSLLDVLNLLETYLHAPFQELSLDAVVSEIASSNFLRFRGVDRVKAIRIVVDWLSKAL